MSQDSGETVPYFSLVMSGLLVRVRSISRLNQNRDFAGVHTTGEGCGIAFFVFWPILAILLPFFLSL
jgi:hypothetical protein